MFFSINVNIYVRGCLNFLGKNLKIGHEQTTITWPILYWLSWDFGTLVCIHESIICANMGSTMLKIPQLFHLKVNHFLGILNSNFWPSPMFFFTTFRVKKSYFDQFLTKLYNVICQINQEIKPYTKRITVCPYDDSFDKYG